MRVVCLTNDVEATTFQGDAYNETMAQRMADEAMPEVLTFYKRMGVKATFFCQGSMMEQYPSIVRMIANDGHELGCHGWVHDKEHAFDIMTLLEQTQHLLQAKHTIDAILEGAGYVQRVVSFRSPALRVNESTTQALCDAGYTHDSSIASQRLDAFMSLGSRKKIQWLGAPRFVYQTALNNLARIGRSGITEVPVSACGLPYISTLMRISPLLIKITRWLLYLETKGDNNKVICFLFHPGELLTNQSDFKIIRRSKNPIVHFFIGVLRAKLKNRNFGEQCAKLYEHEIRFWQRHGYEFKTIGELIY